MLDETSEEFIQLLRDARDAADSLPTVLAAGNTAVTKAAEALASAEAAAASAVTAGEKEAAIIALYGSAQALLDAVTAAEGSATNAQLKAWEAEAEQLTANSYATEAEDVFVKVYTSNGDSTFTETETTEYSALHSLIKTQTLSPENKLSEEEAKALFAFDFDKYVPKYGLTAMAAHFEFSAIGQSNYSPNGMHVYVVRSSEDKVHQYDLLAPYDISGATYNLKDLVTTAQETFPTGMDMSEDGTKAYVVGTGALSIFQYTLSTPFDLSTATYASKTYDISARSLNPEGLKISQDGKDIYVFDSTANKMISFSIATPYDISTCTYSAEVTISSADSVAMTKDMKTLLVLNKNDRTIQVWKTDYYPMANRLYNTNYFRKFYDLSNAGLTFEGFPLSICVSPDGKKMLIGGSSQDMLVQYDIEVV